MPPGTEYTSRPALPPSNPRLRDEPLEGLGQNTRHVSVSVRLGVPGQPEEATRALTSIQGASR
jgi:hypothetical protein